MNEMPESNLTYRQLLKILQKMDDNWLDANISVYLSGEEEYMPVCAFRINEEDDVLDAGHPYLEVDF
jgi:hypothetical protein